MSDLEMESEDIQLLTVQAPNATLCNSSSLNKEQYQAQEIEKFLKMSNDPKQYIVTKNVSSLIKSDVGINFVITSISSNKTLSS
jgi:hypothetical protein